MGEAWMMNYVFIAERSVGAFRMGPKVRGGAANKGGQGRVDQEDQDGKVEAGEGGEEVIKEEPPVRREDSIRRDEEERRDREKERRRRREREEGASRVDWSRGAEGAKGAGEGDPGQEAGGARREDQG